jgi:hypothetical protein
VKKKFFNSNPRPGGDDKRAISGNFARCMFTQFKKVSKTPDLPEAFSGKLNWEYEKYHIPSFYSKPLIL